MQEAGSMHIEDGALLALIDGEAPDGESPQAHVDGCDDCSRRLQELRFADRRAKGALESLDVASPWTEMPEELREAARTAVTPITTARRSRRLGGRSIAAAAGLVLVLAAGAYAVPGSPLRSFLSGPLESIGALFNAEEVGPVDPGPTQVAVDPVDGAVRVAIEAAGSGLRVRIRVADVSEATVSARDGRFGVEAGEVRLTDADGEVSVELPASVEGTVEVDGTPVARVSGGTVTRLPGADAVPAAIVVETTG